MSKGYDEIAGDIVCQLLAARGVAISGSGSVSATNNNIKEYLSDDAVASAYRAVYDSILKAIKQE